jgi:type I restriction enzyme S subunit
MYNAPYRPDKNRLFNIPGNHKGKRMKSNWRKVRLGEVCEIKYGKAHNQLSNGSIPVYGSGGIIRYVDSFLYSKKSVLIPRKGTLENLFFVVKPFWTSDTMFYTQIYEKKIMPGFLYYQLFALNLANMNVGAAVPILTTAVPDELEISLPPLPARRAIAATLFCLDDKITLNDRINASLEARSRAIFKSLFADFEPFKGGNNIKESHVLAAIRDTLPPKPMSGEIEVEQNP